MSRIGKQPIKVEEGIKIEITDGGNFNHTLVKAIGPKGELDLSVRKGIKIALDSNQITVIRENDTKRNRALHGLYRTLIANMIEGVEKGYEKELEIVGVGYKVVMKGTDLELALGLNHLILFKVPEGIKFEVSDNVNIKISGIDKVLVGNTAAKIREIKKPEPYKGKGIRYKGEYVKRKAGKAAITATT